MLESGKVTINLIGNNPSIGVKRTKFLNGNHVTIEINNIEINMDLKDFKYLIDDGDREVSEYHESKAGLEARIEELQEALEAWEMRASA
ncbi:MAG TPA: hypothetical protein VN549_06190 [Negativicutes bacterium]|nr:hypothetical protein [Negativicutes bacterium]